LFEKIKEFFKKKKKKRKKEKKKKKKKKKETLSRIFSAIDGSMLGSQTRGWSSNHFPCFTHCMDPITSREV